MNEMTEDVNAADEAKRLIDDETQLAERKAALVAQLRANIEAGKAALVALGAARQRKPRAEGNKRGRPKGSKNRPASVSTSEAHDV